MAATCQQVRSYGHVDCVLAASWQLNGQASQRSQQREPVTWKETGQVSPGTPAVNTGRWQPYLGRLGRGSEPELAHGRSESAGPFAPGEGTARVQVGHGAAPKRLVCGGRALKTGADGSKRVGPTVLR